jgi:hypothetical protein
MPAAMRPPRSKTLIGNIRGDFEGCTLLPPSPALCPIRLGEKDFRNYRPMNSNSLSQHIAATYQASRVGLAIIAFCFPPWLVIGGLIFGPVKWQDSMSAYYHASNVPDPLDHPELGPMRNWFVGLLFGLGIIFYLYKGFTKLENWALNIAGIMALGVALFPMAWGPNFPGKEAHLFGLNFSLHGTFAVSLFLCIAYVCIFRASDTLPLLKDKAKEEKYHKKYQVLGHLMWGFPVIAWILSSTAGGHYYVFFAEMLGVWIFAIFWWVKSREIQESSADLKAMSGHLHVEKHGLSHLLKPVRISPELGE